MFKISLSLIPVEFWYRRSFSGIRVDCGNVIAVKAFMIKNTIGNFILLLDATGEQFYTNLFQVLQLKYWKKSSKSHKTVNFSYHFLVQTPLYRQCFGNRENLGVMI